MSEEPLITARQLVMAYGNAPPILQDIDLQIERGAFVSIVGPSGCGKSTLLRLLAGLREPIDGALTVAGARPVEAQARTAFVFQEPNLLPWRTVAGNIRLPLELDRSERRVPVSRSAAPLRTFWRRSGGSSTVASPLRTVTARFAARLRAFRAPRDSSSTAALPRRYDRETSARLVEESIRLIGLSPDDADKRPRELSGGMRMRVSLARALVTEPQIMLLDEPFAALDDILRQQLNEELQRLWWDKRWTGLFVTHNVAEAVFLSQRILVMSQVPGTILESVSVPFDFPRSHELRSDPEFAKLTGTVSRALRQAARDVRPVPEE